MTESAKRGTAARILEAADELFCKVGYDGVSIRDVAEKAGVNKASVFYYYNSKDELFQKVIGRYYAAHQAALEGAVTDEGTQKQRLLRVIDVYLDFIYENRQYPRLVQGMVGKKEHRVHLQRSMEDLYQWCQSVIGDIAPEDGPLSVRQIFITFSGAVVHYVTHGPLLENEWDDPLGAASLEERRAHLHWLASTCLDELERQSSAKNQR